MDRTRGGEELAVQILATQTPFRLAMPVLSLQSLGSGNSSVIENCPPIGLENITDITLTVECKYDENASLRIYNASGQLVRIINLSDYPAEEQITLTWDGKDGSGEEIKQGIYLVRYLSKNATKTIRVVKIR